MSAELEGGYWLKPLKDASDYWAMELARRLIEAYAAAEVALGAERAVGFAMRGEAWRPFDPFRKRRRRSSSERRAVRRLRL